VGAQAIATYFFKDKPVFGFDLGHGSFKIMQCDTSGKRPRVLGYGTAAFDSEATDDGVILKPEVIAKAAQKMFEHDFHGKLTTRRAAIALPSYRSFSRAIQLPKLEGSELQQAVELELEQYIPVPLKDMYIDYAATHQQEDVLELFAVAIPRKIVDSYLELAECMGMEPILIETTMASVGRLFSYDDNSDVSTVIIDFGSLTADIGIYNKTTLVTGTVPAGGLVFTKLIKDKLKVSEAEAGFIKTKYGLSLSKKQEEITEALAPALQKIVTEIRRMSRYYEERYGSEHKIAQVVILGGGANMPGLGDYLTNILRMPVRAHNPWNTLDYPGLEAPSGPDRLMYATVAGLSLLNPEEAFR
jgi:type IV pilus assembly protein PilM